jgi:hypothetical protein
LTKPFTELLNAISSAHLSLRARLHGIDQVIDAAKYEVVQLEREKKALQTLYNEIDELDDLLARCHGEVK